MHEIGYWEGEITESTPANPRSMYGIAKNTLRQATEIMTADANITFQWLRAYYILGDDLRNNSVFCKILKLAQQGQDTFPFNSGKNKYDFITVQDLARQIALTVVQNEVNGVINCCSGQPMVLREQVEKFIAEHGLSIQPQYGVFPERAYDSPAIWGNPDKINRIIENRNALKYGE